MQYDLNLLILSSFFPLVSCNYDEKLAKQCLYLSSAAYSNATNQGLCLGTIFTGNNSNYRILDSFEEICDEVGHNCSGFIVEASPEKNLFYVFSGSQGPKNKNRKLIEGVRENEACLNLLHMQTQNLMQSYAALKPDKDFYGMGQVMGNFKNAHDALWSHVKPSWTDPKYKDYSVIITGHSMRGSLATLAAARCCSIGYCSPNKVKLYTFGEPRTGSVKFAKILDAMIGENFRVVHRFDSVPEVPACTKRGGLFSLFFNTGCSDALPTNSYHHGKEIWYNKDMINEPYVICTELTSIQNCPFSYKYINSFLWNGAAHIEEHKHYFDIVVTEYGKTGCTEKTKTVY